MTENHTSKAVKEVLDRTPRSPIVGGIHVQLPIECLEKYLRMENALKQIASTEPLTFAECVLAETIISTAENALSFDPLST